MYCKRAVPGGESPLTISHDGFLRFVTAPPTPGIGGLPKPPLPKGGASACRGGGDKRLAGFHIGYCFQKVPAVNPSVTAAPCQLPLAREPFYARYRSMVRYRAFLSSQSTTWAQRTSKSNKPKRGQGVESTTRAKAKGQSPDGSTRGILKGEQFERERVAPPLSRTTFHTFLPEQESMALLASTCRRLIGE